MPNVMFGHMDLQSIRIMRTLHWLDKFIRAFLENLGFKEFGQGVGWRGERVGVVDERREEEIIQGKKKAKRQAYGAGKNLSP